MIAGSQGHANLLSGDRSGSYFTGGCVGAVNLAHTGIQPPDRPARNELLYRLR